MQKMILLSVSLHSYVYIRFFMLIYNLLTIEYKITVRPFDKKVPEFYAD